MASSNIKQKKVGTNRTQCTEYFSKELISKMRISSKIKLKSDEYWEIEDPWKAEYEKAVQVPADTVRMPRPFNCFRIQDETIDRNWLKVFNIERNKYGLPEICTTLFQNIYENIEAEIYVSFQKEIKSGGRLGVEYEEGAMCEVEEGAMCEVEEGAICDVEEGAVLEEVPIKKDSSSSEEKTNSEAQEILDEVEVFYNYVKRLGVEDINIRNQCELLKCDEDVIGFIFYYWKLKICSNSSSQPPNQQGLWYYTTRFLKQGKKLSGEDSPSSKRVKVTADLVDDSPLIGANSPTVLKIPKHTARKTSPG